MGDKTMKKRILIVEDDEEIRNLLKGFLENNGFTADEAGDGLSASKHIASEKYEMILLDMMLPFKPGNILIKELRALEDPERSKTPVIVISAKSTKDTRLEVLRMGADDYIIKPFDLDEVLVRIEVVLRRSEAESSSQSEEEVLSHNGLVLDREQNSVMFSGTALKLTSKELQLLELFLRYPQKTFTKANLYETVWGEPYYYEDNTINVHLSNLRSKLKKATGKEFVETVWGIGYRLEASE